MTKASQLSLLKTRRKKSKIGWIEKQNIYGGALEYRKIKRPFDSRKLTHIVFKARAGEVTSLRKRETAIVKIMYRVAQKYGVAITLHSVQKNHVHVLAYTKMRLALTNFLRLFSAEVGRLYSKLFRMWGIRKSQNLWVSRPFTRLVSFKNRELATVKNYIRKNTFEALGFFVYNRNTTALQKFVLSKVTSKLRRIGKDFGSWDFTLNTPPRPLPVKKFANQH